MRSRALDHIAKPVADDLRRLGELIRGARARRGFTQAELAQRLRVSPTTVRAAEQGDPKVAAGILVSLLWVLGIGPMAKALAGHPELQRVHLPKQRIQTQKNLDDF